MALKATFIAYLAGFRLFWYIATWLNDQSTTTTRMLRMDGDLAVCDYYIGDETMIFSYPQCHTRRDVHTSGGLPRTLQISKCNRTYAVPKPKAPQITEETELPQIKEHLAPPDTEFFQHARKDVAALIEICSEQQQEQKQGFAAFWSLLVDFYAYVAGLIVAVTFLLHIIDLGAMDTILAFLLRLQGRLP